MDKNRVLLIYTPLVLYWIILFIATSLPTVYLPSTGVSDKLSHFTAYLVLSILLFLTFLFQKKFSYLSSKPLFSTILIITIYAVVDEVHQAFIPGRSCEGWDLLADFIGTLIGTFIINYLSKKFLFTPT